MSNLLTVALDAHGGIEQWRRTESITATVTVGGALFEVKAPHVDLGTVQATADTSRPRLTFPTVRRLSDRSIRTGTGRDRG